MRIDTVRAAIAEAIEAGMIAAHNHAIETPKLEVPPNRQLGDLAWPGALPLARALRMAPRKIAESLVEAAEWPEIVDRVEIAGPGFLNFFIDRPTVLCGLLAQSADAPASGTKIVVEHTNINPNKAAHVGHLRNAVLGDCLVRCLRHLGHEVEVQNYIDDTGVQVADIAVGLLHLPLDLLADLLDCAAERGAVLSAFVARMPEGAMRAATDDFDDLCWNIYPRVTQRYAEDEAFKAHRAEILHAVEGGGAMELGEAISALSRGEHDGAAIAALAGAIADGNVRAHLATMARLGVGYDVLPHESDILHLGFWARAFELLEASGAIRLEAEGKNAGCWVMSLASSPEFADMEDPDKILVRSSGTVTYTGKDIAYQMWKLGLLEDADGSRKDFGYEPYLGWSQDGPAAKVVYQDLSSLSRDHHLLRRTCDDRTASVRGRCYGAGDRVYNVIDVRQSYPQKVVREAVRVLGHPEAADASIHFAYEMVALTPKAVREIEESTGVSFGLDEETMSKAFIEMSGRKGIGVKADELIDILIDRARAKILERTEGKEPDDLVKRSRAIAVGALRYLMAKQSRNKVLAFDFDEALAFEGDTGPYLQYSAVRPRKIFAKVSERLGEGPVSGAEIALLEGIEIPDDLWDLVLACSRRDEMVELAVGNLEFSQLAAHAYELASTFHKLYAHHSVLKEEDVSLRRLRRAVFGLFQSEIEIILEKLLGIPVPEAM